MKRMAFLVLGLILAGACWASGGGQALPFEGVFTDSFERPGIGPYWEDTTISGVGYPGWGIDADGYNSPQCASSSPSGIPGEGNSVRGMKMVLGVDLSQSVSASISYWAQWDVKNGSDFCQLYASADGGYSWQAVGASYTGTSGWAFVQESLPQNMRGNNVKIMFVLSNGNGQRRSYTGWQVDNVSITRQIGPIHDVAATDILEPAGNIPFGDSVAPIAVYANLGNQPENVRLYLQMGQGETVYYRDSLTVSLGVSGVLTDTFRRWNANPAGDYQIKAWAYIANDTNRSNDTAYGTFRVTSSLRDVAVSRIVAPVGIIAPGMTIPSAMFWNLGTTDEVVRTYCWILNSADETLYSAIQDSIGMPRGESLEVSFQAWLARPSLSFYRVLFAVQCVPPDVDPGDDSMVGQFLVESYTHDMAAIQVVSPIDSCHPGDVGITALFQNFGTSAELGVPVRLAIYDNQMNLVTELAATIPVLGSGYSQVVNLGTWTAATGYYVFQCFAELATDQNRENDTVTVPFCVTPWDTGGGGGIVGRGWVQKENVPAGLKMKRVKNGTATASADFGDSRFIYGLKGNSTYEFYRYNIEANTWSTMESITPMNRAGKKKKVKKGATLAFASGKFYATKGGNTYDFWEYDPATGLWTQRADVPIGSRKVGAGASATTVNYDGIDYVYLLKGGNSLEFYRYQPAADVWQRLPNAPTGPSARAYKVGSCITYDPVREEIFLLKGTFNEFTSFNVRDTTWDTLPTLPFFGSSGRKKKAKDGSGLAVRGGRVYALKGGNTYEFFSYSPDSHKWFTERDILPAVSNKKVKDGGTLVYSPTIDRLFATKGSNTLEFYTYIFDSSGYDASPKPNIKTVSSLGQSVVFGVFPNPLMDRSRVNYYLPNAGRVTLRLFDVGGRLVQTLVDEVRPAGIHSAALERGGLSAGIYLLRLRTDDRVNSTKVIVAE